MLKFCEKIRMPALFSLLFLGAAVCHAAKPSTEFQPLAPQKAAQTNPLWDPARHISLDEIQPGMQAYCLTVYKGSEVEKFDLEVLSVIRNMFPGRNAILVQGTDERFIHTGPVAGCSGSPVYIDGRLAGALAFMWVLSKDPLYGVTPIDEMLRIGQTDKSQQTASQTGFTLDLSGPIDFDRIYQQITTDPFTKKSTFTSAAASPSRTANGVLGVPLPCPLVVSGLSAGVCQQLQPLFEPFGLMPVSGLGTGQSLSHSDPVQLAPGAALAIPLVSGDITMTVIGTVTDVVDDKVYGLGHGFLGYGPIDLPMATAQVHTVVSSIYRSFKLASALEIVGALSVDESAGVYGQIGAEAAMIPITITIDRYNDTQKRIYNCQAVDNRLLTPVLLGYLVAGTTLVAGNLPPDHMIEYKAAIDIEGFDPVTFENVSTSSGLTEIMTETTASLMLLFNNPYEKVNVKSVEVDIQIVPKNIAAHIWSVELSDSKVKPGDNVDIAVIVESFLAGKKKYHYSFQLPENLQPGKYSLLVTGAYGYYEFLRKAAPYKFVPQNVQTLIKAMNNILHIRRDRLYCILQLSPAGIAVEKAQLPDLPATKALVLSDAKRTLRTLPYQQWLEKSLRIGNVVIGKKVMKITVEK